MKRDTHGRILRSRSLAERIAPARCVRAFPPLSLSTSLFFFQENVTQAAARHRSSRFFQNAFQRAFPRLSHGSVAAGGKITRSRAGTRRNAHAATRQERSALLLPPFRTHNAPRAAQGKFSRRRENRCFIRLYRRTRERLDLYVRNVAYCTALGHDTAAWQVDSRPRSGG